MADWCVTRPAFDSCFMLLLNDTQAFNMASWMPVAVQACGHFILKQVCHS